MLKPLNVLFVDKSERLIRQSTVTINSTDNILGFFDQYNPYITQISSADRRIVVGLYSNKQDFYPEDPNRKVSDNFYLRLRNLDDPRKLGSYNLNKYIYGAKFDSYISLINNNLFNVIDDIIIHIGWCKEDV
jgi:hypothetical protein